MAHSGRVIHIKGPSASGKTQLVYYLAQKTLLAGHVVVVYDTSESFDLDRFTNLHPDMAAIVHRLVLFRPTNTAQLALSLASLSGSIASATRHALLGMVIVDGLSDFYWEDKFIGQLLQSTPSPPPRPLSRVLSALERIRVDLGPAIVFTTWGPAQMAARTIHTDEYAPLPLHTHVSLSARDRAGVVMHVRRFDKGHVVTRRLFMRISDSDISLLDEDEQVVDF